jgi:hypothetical protein
MNVGYEAHSFNKALELIREEKSRLQELAKSQNEVDSDELR